MTIVLLILGIITAFIIARIVKREWLGPIISGLIFVAYSVLGSPESPDALYFGILACFVQFVAAFRMYRLQLQSKDSPK
jgi:hypothetical protein